MILSPRSTHDAAIPLQRLGGSSEPDLGGPFDDRWVVPTAGSRTPGARPSILAMAIPASCRAHSDLETEITRPKADGYVLAT